MKQTHEHYMIENQISFSRKYHTECIITGERYTEHPENNNNNNCFIS